MRPPFLAVLRNLAALALSPLMIAQDLPPQPKIGAKVCVARVANASTTSAFVERLTERLSRSLKQNKINAVTMHSETTDKYPLQLSTDVGEEVNRTIAIMSSSRKSAIHDSIHSNHNCRRFQLVVVFPVWMRATRLEGPQARFIEKTYSSILHCSA